MQKIASNQPVSVATECIKRLLDTDTQLTNTSLRADQVLTQGLNM